MTFTPQPADMRLRALRGTAVLMVWILQAVLAAAPCRAANVLLVVHDSSLNSEESARRTAFQGWGHTVTTIVDDYSQSTFDTAVASADVVYIPCTIQDWELGTKVKNVTCGVVLEHPYMDANMGFSNSLGYPYNGTQTEILDNTHPVTSGLSMSGKISIVSSTQPLAWLNNTLAGGFTLLGQDSYYSPGLMFGVIDTGGALSGGGTAAGRRVRLPFGGSSSFNWSALNSNGLKIAQQAISWAVGKKLLLHWKLDETSGTSVTDSSEHNRTGTANGAANWVAGRRNNAFELNGFTKIERTDLLDQPKSFTVAAWARLDSADSEGAEVVSIGDYIGLRLDDYWHSGSTNAFFYYGSDWETVVASSGHAGTGWHHFLATFDDASNSFKLYIDGALAASKTTSYSISWSGQGTKTVVGASGNGETVFDFDGTIDDVRVYNYALTESEIAEVYGLLAHWELDETSGTTANDASLANNDASLTGTEGWTNGVEQGGHAFDYTNGQDYFTAPTNDALDDVQEDDYTVMAYYRPESVPSGSGSDITHSVLIKNGYHLGLIYNSSQQFQIDHWLSGDVLCQVISTDTTRTPGRFYHVAAVVSRTAGEVRLYVDGGLIGTNTFTAGTTSRDYGSNPWRIGVGSPGGNYPSDGVVDDARIYNRALSAEEILAIAKTRLLGHWELDETSGTTAGDSALSPHDGTLTGGPVPGSSGVRKYALSCDGSDDYVSVAATTDLEVSGLVSMSAWVKPNPTGNAYRLIINKEGEYEMGLSSAGYIMWALANTSPGWNWHTTSAQISDNEWSHIAVIYDGSNVLTYVNGVLEESYSANGAIGDSHATLDELRIAGRSNNPANQYFGGLVDDVRVYGYDLTTSEVAEIYGLIGHWAMDEGAGGTLADSSGMGNDATLSGSTWTSDCSGNYALAFDGTGQTAVTDSNVDPPPVGAVALWMRSSGPKASRERPWGVGSDFEMWQDTDGLVSCDVSTDGYQGGFITDEPLDEEGRWYHIIAQYDSTDDSYEIYINGELHKSGISTWDITDQAANLLTFGNRTENTTEYWEGQLRDFRLYNRHLVDSEIIDISKAAGHWPMDETSGSTATDQTVIANTGTYHSSPTLGINSVYAPENGTAVLFNGVSEYLEIPHDDAMLADNGTVMFWFRSSDPTSDQGLFSKDSAGFDTGGHLTFRLTGGKVEVRLQSTTDDYFVESPVVAASKWRHVAFTWGTGGMNLYIDGQLADSDLSYTGGLGTTSGGAGNFEPIVLGANSWASSDLSPTPLQEYLHGALDDLRCYARAFCSDEVYKIYRGGRSPGVRIIQWTEVR